jgi:hypothetical protein
VALYEEGEKKNTRKIGRLNVVVVEEEEEEEKEEEETEEEEIIRETHVLPVSCHVISCATSDSASQEGHYQLGPQFIAKINLFFTTCPV